MIQRLLHYLGIHGPNWGNYPFDVGTARCSVPATGRREAGDIVATQATAETSVYWARWSHGVEVKLGVKCP